MGRGLETPFDLELHIGLRCCFFFGASFGQQVTIFNFFPWLNSKKLSSR